MSSVPSFSFCSTANVESRWENGKQRSVQIEEDFEIESCRQTGESEVRNKRAGCTCIRWEENWDTCLSRYS